MMKGVFFSTLVGTYLLTFRLDAFFKLRRKDYHSLSSTDLTEKWFYIIIIFMMQVFGLQAEEIMRGKTKCYVLVNTLPAEARGRLVRW